MTDETEIEKRQRLARYALGVANSGTVAESSAIAFREIAEYLDPSAGSLRKQLTDHLASLFTANPHATVRDTVNVVEALVVRKIEGLGPTLEAMLAPHVDGDRTFAADEVILAVIEALFPEEGA